MSEQKKMDAERAAFEAWWVSRPHRNHPEKFANGDYCAPSVHSAWGAWQARASLPVGVPDVQITSHLDEEVEVRGLQWLDTGHYRKKPPKFGYNPHDWNTLMTVAQHERIVAALSAQLRDANNLADQWAEKNAALSAQQSAPYLVSVPVELLERIAGKGCDPDCCIAYWREQLRALLASHAEGGEV